MNYFKSYSGRPFSFAAFVLIILSAVITVAVMLFVVLYIAARGIPNISLKLFSLRYNSENVSMLPSIVNTVYMTAISLALAVPVGIFAAVYLVEYTHGSSKLVKLIRITTETLAGIPSIVYGLFGFLAFVTALGWGYSLIAGAVTLAIMVLPVIIRTGEEALLAVPKSYKEGSFGLGAGKVRTVFKIIIPSAMPGILSGVILSAGRIVGETAALIFTAGTSAKVPVSLTDSARTLSVHMYCLLSEGMYTNEAFATAAVLLVLVAGINALSEFAAKRLSR